MNNFNLRKYLAENILLKESQDLVSRIGDLEDILWNGGNRRAEKEWEIVSGEYLPGEQGAEYWDDLDDYDLRSAIDDAEHIMKKYEMGEEVNEGYEDQLFLKSKMKQSFLEGWKSAQLPTKQTDVQAFERFWNKQSVGESVNEAQKFKNKEEVVDALVKDFGKNKKSYYNTPTNKQNEKFWTYNRTAKHYYDLLKKKEKNG